MADGVVYIVTSQKVWDLYENTPETYEFCKLESLKASIYRCIITAFASYYNHKFYFFKTVRKKVEFLILLFTCSGLSVFFNKYLSFLLQLFDFFGMIIK